MTAAVRALARLIEDTSVPVVVTVPAWKRIRAAKVLKATPGSEAQNLGIEVPHQEQSEWCWCAVAVGVRKFFDSGFAMSQCQAANGILQVATACIDPASDAANKPIDLQVALQFMHVFRPPLLHGPLKFEDLKKELDDRKCPVAARVLFTSDGRSHFTVIRGYQDGPEPMLAIDDPFYDESEIPYAEFVSRYKGTGEWTHTYLTQAHHQ